MKNKKLSRILAAILALLTLSGVLASCSSDTGDNTADTTAADVAETTAADTTPKDSLEARKLISDDVPELDFGGKDFRIFYQKRYTTDAVPPAGEENGEIINDAVYRRNKTVEERFNVKVVGIVGEERAQMETLVSSVTSGEDAYDLYLGHSIYAGTAALGGCFRNWYEIPHIDFTKPWFPQEAIEELTINDRMYLTMGDLALSFIENVYCMFFNKQMAEANDVEDIYGLVHDGQWTLDKVAEISDNMYVDLNGDGAADAEDQYGFSGYYSNHPATWLFSCDIDTVEFHDDGTVESVFMNERAVSFFEKLKSLYYKNPGSIPVALGLDENGYLEVYREGRALLLTGALITSQKNLRDLETDYGIIPYAKFDEEQEHYYTIPGGSVSSMAVPMTVTDDALVGAITAALSRESYVNVVPAYYDIALKVKGTRDETSIEMLDLIMDGRMVSTSFLYDNWKGYTYSVTKILTEGQELASYTAANDSKVTSHYESVLELFYN